jgi:hypothetical protein
MDDVYRVRIWLNIVKLVFEPVVTYFSFCVSPFHKHKCFTREWTFNIIFLIYGIKWLIARSSLFVSLILMIYQKTNMIHNSMLNILQMINKKKNGKISMRYRSSTIIIMYMVVMQHECMNDAFLRSSRCRRWPYCIILYIFYH